MGKVGVWGCVCCISCFLLERLSEALSWFDTGAFGTAGLMYRLGIFTSK